MFVYAKLEHKQVAKNTVQKKETDNKSAPNLTGISAKMKSKFEGLSGFSFSDVKVHHNSDKLVQMQALADTQENQAYVAPKQRKRQFKGFSINNDPKLEQEAENPSIRIDSSKVIYKSGETEKSLVKYIQQDENLMSSPAVIQRQIATAQWNRAICNNITGNVNANFNQRTVGVSNNNFAITPELGGNLQQQAAQAHSGGRNYAGPVPGGGQAGNHSEKKLISHGLAGCAEIGVDRTICQGCANAICNNANPLGIIQHVSSPNGTFQATPAGLVWVAP